MAYVSTAPAAIAAAATQLEGIGNSFTAESSAAAAPTTAIAPAASDEVSVLQAGVFSSYGQRYGVKPKVMPPIPKPTIT